MAPYYRLTRVLRGITWYQRRSEECVEEDIAAAGLVELAAERQLLDQWTDTVVLRFAPNFRKEFLAESVHLLVTVIPDFGNREKMKLKVLPVMLV